MVAATVVAEVVEAGVVTLTAVVEVITGALATTVVETAVVAGVPGTGVVVTGLLLLEGAAVVAEAGEAGAVAICVVVAGEVEAGVVTVGCGVEVALAQEGLFSTT